MPGTYLFHLLRWIAGPRFLVTVGVALCLKSFPASYSAENPLDENTAHSHQLVAEVVLGILSYARWPDAASRSNKQLCLVGPTEFADTLRDTAISFPGWNPSVQRVSPDYQDIATDCQAIYTGVLLENERAQLSARLEGQPVLTISEQNDSCEVSTLFCLRIEDGRVGFEVNLDSVERSGIRINPNVLRLGSRLQGEP